MSLVTDEYLAEEDNESAEEISHSGKWKEMSDRIFLYLKENHIEIIDIKDHSKRNFRKRSIFQSPTKKLESSALL